MKNKKIPKSVTITPHTDKYIRDHMKAQGLTNYSAALDDAVEYAFNPEFRGEREAELTKKINQFSYSLNEHRKKTGRDFAILQEMMLATLFEIYKRSPDVPDDLEEVKNAQALALLDKVADKIAANLSETRPMKESD